MRPFQHDPSTIPEHLRHVVVLDFREAIPPGAMCERVRTFASDEPAFVSGRGPYGQASADPGDPVRSIAMLHAWLSDGDVAPGGGWTRRERWDEFAAHLLDSTGVAEHADRVNPARFVKAGSDHRFAAFDDDLFAEAIRYLQAPYHISGGVSSDGTPFVVLAHPANLYTHHGNEGNRDCIGVGFAWGRDLYIGSDPKQVSTDNRARRDAVEAALWLAHKHYGTRTLVTHAQANRGRVPSEDGSGGCPGANIVWAAGHGSVVVGTDRGLSWDIERTWGSGRTPPPAWLTAFSKGVSASIPTGTELLAEPGDTCRNIACELERIAEAAGVPITLRTLIKSTADMARVLGGGA